MKIGFIGMSHLGVCHAITTAEKGFAVKCYDENYQDIENLRNGITNFYEPNLNKIFKRNKKNIFFTNSITEMKECDLVFFSKDVPTNSKNQSSYNGINKLIIKTLKNLHKNSIFIILSQVQPGFTENIKWPKKNLYYQVETLIFGDAVKRALSPQQFIIGSFKNKINNKYSKFLKSYNCKINIMNYQSAELAKISINLYLISSLSFTNSLAELCEKKDIDWSKIKSILQQDKRIGKYAYLNPGLGILSGNLQRDLQSYKKILIENNCKLNIPLAWEKNSNLRKNWVQNLLNGPLRKFLKKKIGIYGLTYKKNITILKNSPAVSLIKKFKNTDFIVYDPKVEIKNFNLKNVIVHDNLIKFLKSSELLLILTDWDEIKNYKYSTLVNYKGREIVDPYGTINLNKFKKDKKIFTLAKKLR